jgi:protein-tyrosine-phosphatase
MREDELPRSVLFLCTSNAIRSQMAAALMRLRYGPLVRVESAGLRPAEEVSAMAAFVVDEVGADMARARPKAVDALDPEEGVFDLIVSLSPEAHHRALDLTPRLARAAEYWPTFDPSLTEGSREQVILEYRSVRDALARRIATRFPRPSTG